MGIHTSNLSVEGESQTQDGGPKSFNHPSPLIPVSEIPVEQLPMVHIEKPRRDALEVCGTKRAKDNPGTIKNHIRGVKGEYAVAKYYGDPEQVDTEIRRYGDGGVDLEILGAVQVKTCGSHVNNPRLLVDAKKELRADYYVLVQELSRCAYRLIGYAPKVVVADASVSRFRLDGYTKRLRTIEQCDLWQPPQPIYSKERI